MRKIALLLCAAFMMSASMPVYAADTASKDECLLASRNCATEVDSIQKKIKKLDAEIKKGKKVYSAEEIKKLQTKLDEANKMLDTMLAP